jgi:hypothetical protein
MNTVFLPPVLTELLHKNHMNMQIQMKYSGESTVETKHLQCAGFVRYCLVKEHQATKEGHEEYHFQFLE